MKTSPDNKTAGKLRKRAESILRKQSDRIEHLSRRSLKQLVHDLGTHQIELELQNEELRRAQAEQETLHLKYVELYDFAPIGYLTLTARGIIREANLAAAQMLEVARGRLANVPFAPFLAGIEDVRAFRAFCKQTFTTGVRQSCELRLMRKNRSAMYAELQGLATENIDDKAGFIRIAALDITERKRAEEERDRSVREHLQAQSRIKVLSGLLPICMHCHKIRDDEGYWKQLEAYLSEHSEALFSHGLCPECAKRFYPKYVKNGGS